MSQNGQLMINRKKERFPDKFGGINFEKHILFGYSPTAPSKRYRLHRCAKKHARKPHPKRCNPACVLSEFLLFANIV